ncbi:hypothetical protein DV736_g1031, partial [Chaetothyriales sp. CBS 134916]
MAASNDNTFSHRNNQIQPSSVATSRPVYGCNSPQNALDEPPPQQRRRSLPPHTTHERLSTRQTPHPDITAPTLASAPSSPEYRLADHAARPVEKAIDPRKRTRAGTSSARSPSSGPALAANVTAPPPIVSSSTNTLDASAASPASNSPPEMDTQMADGADASPAELMANLLVAFMEAGVAAGLAHAQNCQTKAEVDRAVQEHNKYLEKVRNKPSVLDFLEKEKRDAEQDHNITSQKLASASKYRDSTAQELVKSVLKYFQDYSTQTSKSLEQKSSDWHTELRPCIDRLDRLESTQANPYTGIDGNLLTSFESRVAAFEASAVSNRAQVMQKMNAYRQEDQKRIDSLDSQIKDLSSQLNSLSTRVNRVHELDHLSDLEQDSRNPQKLGFQSDLKGQITRLEIDMADLKHEVTSMRAERQKPADPLAASSMFLDYVKRYQQNRAEDLGELKIIAEASSLTRQKLQEHETKMSSSLQAVYAEIATWEASQALLKDRVAGINQDRSKQAESVTTQLETELRSTSASHSSELNQLKLRVDSLIQLERRTMEDVSKKIQHLDSLTRTMDQNLSKQVTANEHSIKALTARYNNLSSEQLAMRMAHHLNPFPGSLQLEQDGLRTRMDHLEAQHHEQKITLDTINATIRDGALRPSSDETSRQNFENRMKTEYYDVLDDKFRKYRDDIRDSIESLGSGIKTAQEALQHRVDELERKALLSSFQQTTNQKPYYPPETTHRGLSEPSDSLSDKAERDGIINRLGKQSPSDQVQDSIVARPVPPSSRKRPR